MRAYRKRKCPACHRLGVRHDGFCTLCNEFTKQDMMRDDDGQ